MEEVLVDYWAHQHFDDPKLRTEETSDDFDADLAEAEAELGIPAEPLASEAPPDPGDFETIADDNFGMK